MSRIAEIEGEIKEAMKARDAERRDALRLIVNALKSSEKELQRPLSEDEELQVLQRERKKRLEAAKAFRSGGREEQAEQEETELDVLEALGFSPEEIDAAEAHALGQGSLADLDEEGVFAEVGEIELSAFIAMTAALEAVCDAPGAAPFDLPWDAEATHAARLQSLAAREGLRAAAFRRHPMPANFVLDLPAAAEAAPPRRFDPQAQPPERIVEKIIERERTRRKLPDRRKGYIQKAAVGGH